MTLEVSRDLFRKQRTIIGSWTFSTVSQVEYARFVADRKIAVDRPFTHGWRLDQVEEAYRLFDQHASGLNTQMSVCPDFIGWWGGFGYYDR